MLERPVSNMRSLGFPAGSADDLVSDLHARLAEYDGHVAGLLQRQAAGEPIATPIPRNDELAAELASIAKGGREPAASDARRLLQHLESVHELVNAAKCTNTEPVASPVARNAKGQE